MKKIRWRLWDFPKTYKGMRYCLDCKKSSKTLICTCKRHCYRWCILCRQYCVPEHMQRCHSECNKVKKSRWRPGDFPTRKKSRYYCADCLRESTKRFCVCGRENWQWCGRCNMYASNCHIKRSHKK